MKKTIDLVLRVLVLASAAMTLSACDVFGPSRRDLTIRNHTTQTLTLVKVEGALTYNKSVEIPVNGSKHWTLDFVPQDDFDVDVVWNGVRYRANSLLTDGEGEWTFTYREEGGTLLCRLSQIDDPGDILVQVVTN